MLNKMPSSRNANSLRIGKTSRWAMLESNDWFEPLPDYPKQKLSLGILFNKLIYGGAEDEAIQRFITWIKT